MQSSPTQAKIPEHLAIHPTRFALRYDPPALIIEYKKTNRDGSMRDGVFHHKIDIPRSALAKTKLPPEPEQPGAEKAMGPLFAFLCRRHRGFLEKQHKEQVLKLLWRLRLNADVVPPGTDGSSSGMGNGKNGIGGVTGGANDNDSDSPKFVNRAKFRNRGNGAAYWPEGVGRVKSQFWRKMIPCPQFGCELGVWVSGELWVLCD